MGNQQSETIPNDAPDFINVLKGTKTRARVVRVIDGDTVEAIIPFDKKFIKIRCDLVNVNAAELRGGTKESKEEARRAKDFLEKMVLDSVVEIECQELDGFGRLKVIMTYEGRSIAEAMSQADFSDRNSQ